MQPPPPPPPPFFYVKEPWCDIRHPALCRTAKDYPGLQYTPICESEKEQAELIVTMEHTIPQHSRTRGWEGGDLCRLLPGQEEEGSWLSNLLLNKIFVLIEEKATAAGNKVSTLNSDIFLRMATPSKDTYLKYNFHQLYPNIPDSEVILAPFNHGRHWCLVVVNLKENFSVYLDSLYDGAGAQMAFSRVNNFLTCCASINGINTWTLQNWKYFVLPSSDIVQQLNSDDCGVFVAKWAEHISLGLPLDFTQDEIVTFRYSLILDIVRNSLSLDVHVKNSEKHEKKLPSSTKPNGKPATKRKYQCSGKSTSNKAATAMKTIGKALNGNLSYNQGASCKSSAGPEKVQNKTQFKDHASTDYTTTVSGKDPNITLLDTHHSTCKTGSASENASNKILLDIMDNQEPRDNNNPNPNPDNPNQGTTCNPRFLLTKAPRKTTLDDQETQANTTYGAGKAEPKILTDNHC